MDSFATFDALFAEGDQFPALPKSIHNSDDDFGGFWVWELAFDQGAPFAKLGIDVDDDWKPLIEAERGPALLTVNSHRFVDEVDLVQRGTRI